MATSGYYNAALSRFYQIASVSSPSNNDLDFGLKRLNNAAKVLNKLRNLSPDNTGQCIDQCKEILGRHDWQLISEQYDTALSYMTPDQNLVLRVMNKLQQYIIYALRNCETKDLNQIAEQFFTPYLNPGFSPVAITDFPSETRDLFLNLCDRGMLHRLSGVTLFDLELPDQGMLDRNNVALDNISRELAVAAKASERR